MTVIVNAQQEKFGKKINIATIKVGDGDSKEEIKNAKLKGHGIIAKDADGKLVTTVDGHNYGEEKVQEVIKELLEK